MFLKIDEWLIRWANWCVRHCELYYGITRQLLLSIVWLVLVCAITAACILSLTIFFLIEGDAFIFLSLGAFFGFFTVAFLQYVSSKTNVPISLDVQIRIGRPLRAQLLVFVVGFLISSCIMIFDAGGLSQMNLNDVLLFDLLVTLMFNFALVCTLEYLRCTNSTSVWNE